MSLDKKGEVIGEEKEQQAPASEGGASATTKAQRANLCCDKGSGLGGRCADPRATRCGEAQGAGCDYPPGLGDSGSKRRNRKTRGRRAGRAVREQRLLKQRPAGGHGGHRTGRVSGRAGRETSWKQGAEKGLPLDIGGPSAFPAALAVLGQALWQVAGECGFNPWAISCMWTHVFGWLAAGPHAWDAPGFGLASDGTDQAASQFQGLEVAVQQVQRNLEQVMSAVAALEASMRQPEPPDKEPAEGPASRGGPTYTGGMKPGEQAYQIPRTCAREDGNAVAETTATVMPGSDGGGHKRSAADLWAFLSPEEWAAAGTASRHCFRGGCEALFSLLEPESLSVF